MNTSSAEFLASKANQDTANPNSTANAPEMIGAEMLVQALHKEGVEYVWGYPGGSVLFIYDEIFKQDKFEHILVRHEQAAVHAADGYARATGKVGVALVTSGPGVTNAVTGIATAYTDSIPMVIISGNVPTYAIGEDAFQEADTVGITRPVVKHNFLVKDVRDLPLVIKKAFHIAQTGRPGPVLIDIPKDVSAAKAPFVYPETLEMRSYNPVIKGHSGQIRKAVSLLQEAERPYIYTGGGIILADAAPELKEFADLLGYPVTNTLMGLGGFPGTSPQFLGMLGMHGTYEANMAMQHSDVLIAIGARFDDRVIGNTAHFASHPRKIIHIDIDPSVISKRVKVDVPIVGNLKEVLVEMTAQLKAAGPRKNDAKLAAWWEQINEWRKKDCLKYDEASQIVKPQYVVQKLWELTGGDAFITSDVGQHQMWAAQFVKYENPRTWLNSGGLGTMGYAVPAAMGAKVGAPDSTVWAIDGDGCFQMTNQELVTCALNNIPIKVAIINNESLGMVRQWQEMFYGRRYSGSRHPCPDFKRIAESYGATVVHLDDVHVVSQGGRRPEYREEDGARVMAQSEITIRVGLGRGEVSDTVWTCDFSHDYVTINADYRS